MSNSIVINAFVLIMDWIKHSCLIKWLARFDLFLVNTTRNSFLISGLIRDESPLWHGSRLYQMMLGGTRRINKHEGRLRLGLINSNLLNLPHTVSYKRLLNLTALGCLFFLAANIMLELIYPPVNILGLIVKCLGLLMLALLSRDDIVNIYSDSYMNKITKWIIDYEH